MQKNIIITGASRGIGRELAKTHLLNGNNVLAISRNAEKLEELKVFENNSLFNFLALDLADFDGLIQIQKIINDWENVDVL